MYIIKIMKVSRLHRQKPGVIINNIILVNIWNILISCLNIYISNINFYIVIHIYLHRKCNFRKSFLLSL